MDKNVIYNVIYVVILSFNIPIFFNTFIKNKNIKVDLKFSNRIVYAIGALYLSLTFAILLIMPIEFSNEINNPITLYIYPVFIITYLSIRFVAYIKNYIKIINSDDNRIYIRDVFVDYSPAVLSLLLNHRIENKKDFDASVLNIYSKGAISFELKQQKLNVIPSRDKISVFPKLTEDEKYIYKVLSGKEKFNKQTWHNIIEEQLKIKGFVKKGEKNIILQIIKMFSISFVCFFSLIMLFVLAVLFVPGTFFKDIATNYFKFDTVLSILWILILLPIQLLVLEGIMKLNRKNYLKDRLDYYTEKGALEMLKWKKFGNFIKDFSMLEVAPAQSVALWGKYIAYSMALNINKSYNSYELDEINKFIKQSNWISIDN